MINTPITSPKDFTNASEEELFDMMLDFVSDDDFYTNEGNMSADMIVMFIQDNYEYYFEDCRVREIAEFLANHINGE